MLVGVAAALTRPAAELVDALSSLVGTVVIAGALLLLLRAVRPLRPARRERTRRSVDLTYPTPRSLTSDPPSGPEPGPGEAVAVDRRAFLGAAALLMPSFAEGYGLPVVEALRVGTPVIASDLPALREVGTRAVTYVAPDDRDGWERAIATSLGARTSMDAFDPPTWESHFRLVDDWLESLDGKSDPN